MKAAQIRLTRALKFLVVDDSRAIQAIIRHAITKCGYEPVEIKTAMDGEHALDVLDTFVPDLIITDWHMPKVSGLEMIQALRQLGHKSIRVGFVTTEKTPEMLDQAISNGAMFILHKPFNDAELVAAVISSVQDLAKGLVDAPITPQKKESEPVKEASIQKILKSTLGNIPFRLIPNERMTAELLTVNNLLGLYASAGQKGVYAIGVMDSNAVCMVGGGASRRLPPDVRAVMESGQPDETMLAKANEFMRAVASCLTETAEPDPVAVSLAKASIVKNTFAKLSEVLAQTGRRSDFRIAIPGYGEGRMAFFVMAP